MAMSPRKASALSNGVFLILIAILVYTNSLWPGILFAIGAFLIVRQYFSGRRVDLIITIVVIAIISLVSITGLSLSTLAPLALVLAGLYLILREYFFVESAHDESEKK